MSDTKIMTEEELNAALARLDALSQNMSAPANNSAFVGSTKVAVGADYQIPASSAAYGPASNRAPKNPGLTQQFTHAKTQGEQSPAQFWAGIPGFEMEAAQYLDPDKKTDADDLYKSDLIVKQAQEFLKFRFKNDVGGMSAETQALLNKDLDSLTTEERQDIVAEAIEEAGWIGNNTLSMGKVFAEIKGDASDAEKQATLFMMDISDNLSFSDNWGKKVWRFAYQGILTDPLTVGSIALGAVSFGSGTAAGLGAKEAAKLGMRKFIGEGLRRATGQTVKNSVARGAIQGAEMGAVDAAINNAAEQGIKTEAFTDNAQTEQKRQKEFSTGQVATSAALGGAAGAGFSFFGHSVAHYWNTSSTAKKIRSFFGMEEPAPKEAHDFWGRPKETKSTTDEAGPASNNNEVETTAPGAAPINKAADLNEADDGIELKLNDPLQTSTEPTHTQLGNDINAIKTKRARNKAIKRHNKITDIIANKENFEDVLALAKGDITPKDFLKKHEIDIEDSNFPTAIKKQIVNDDGSDVTDGALTLYAQGTAFQRQVDEAIEHGNTHFNPQKLLNEYRLIKDDSGIQSKINEFNNFKGASQNLIEQSHHLYGDIKKKPNEELTAEEKTFKSQYEKTYFDKNGELRGANNIPKAKNSEEQEKLINKFLAVKRIEKGGFIPEFTNKTSWRIFGFYLKIQNPKNMSFDDMIRMVPKFLPVDGRTNIRNTLQAVDNTFQHYGFQQKIIDLQGKIEDLAAQVKAERLTAEQARDGLQKPDGTQIKGVNELLAEFAQNNKGDIQKMINNISLIEQEVSRWPTQEGSRLWGKNPFAQGISSHQKTQLLDYVGNMRTMLGNVQKNDFGAEALALTKDSTALDVRTVISRVYSDAVESLRTHTYDNASGHKTKGLKDPAGGNLKLEDVYARERLIESEAYIRARTKPNEADLGTKHEKRIYGFSCGVGNTESGLDKSTIALANDLIEKKAWGPQEPDRLATIMAGFIKDNMFQEATYALREFRWRLEAKPGDLYGNTNWLSFLKTKIDVENNLAHAQAYEKLRIMAEPNSRDGGGKPAWFGQEWLAVISGGIDGGGRYVRDKYITLTWNERLSRRMPGGNLIATPVRDQITAASKEKVQNLGRYLFLGQMKVKVKEKNDEGVEVEVDKWVSGTKESHGIIGSIPGIKKLWNHQLAAPLRIGARWAFLPEAAAYHAMKTAYRQFGNTAILLGATGLGAGAIEFAASEAAGTEMPFNIAPRTLNAGFTVIDSVASAVITAEDYKIAVLEAAGLKEDSPIGKMLRLWDAPEITWDFIDENVEFLIKNKIGSYGDESYATSLQNTMNDFDLDSSYQGFKDYFIDGKAGDPALKIEDRIQKATNPLYKKFLTDIQSRFSDITDLKTQIDSEIDQAEAAKHKAQTALAEAQRIEQTAQTSTDAEAANYKAAVDKARKALEEQQAAYNKAINRKDYLCKFLNTSVIADDKIQEAQEQLTIIEQALKDKPSTVERRQLNREKEKIQEKIEKHLAYSTQAYAAVTGQNPELFARKKEAEKKQDNQDVEAASTSGGSPEDGAEAGGDPTQTVKTPFVTQAPPPSLDNEDDTQEEPNKQHSSSSNQYDISFDGAKREFTKAVGADVANPIISTLESTGTFAKEAFNAAKDSNSPWVGGGLAVLAVWLASRFLAPKPNEGTFLGGVTRLLTYATVGLATWAGWRAWKGQSGSPSSDSTSEQSAYRYTPPKSIIVPTIGQSSNSHVFPANDLRYAGMVRSSQDHDGKSMAFTGETLSYAGLTSGNNITPTEFTSVNNPGYTTNQRTQIDSLKHNDTGGLSTSKHYTPNGISMEAVSLQPTGQ